MVFVKTIRIHPYLSKLQVAKFGTFLLTYHVLEMYYLRNDVFILRKQYQWHVNQNVALAFTSNKN